MFGAWEADVLTVTFPRGFRRVTSAAFLIFSQRAAGTRVRSLHPYLSQRHERTKIGKDISWDFRNSVENLISYVVGDKNSCFHTIYSFINCIYLFLSITLSVQKHRNGVIMDSSLSSCFPTMERFDTCVIRWCVFINLTYMCTPASVCRSQLTHFQLLWPELMEVW